MPTAWFNSIVFTPSFSVFKIVVILIGYKKRWSSFFSKKSVLLCLCGWMGLVVSHKNLMVVNGMGGKLAFFLGEGLRFRALIFDDLSHV